MHKIPRIGKARDRNQIGAGRRQRGMGSDYKRVSLWDDESVLKLEGSDGCISL